MRPFWGIVAAQWRLQWRSGGVRTAAVVLGLYSANALTLPRPFSRADATGSAALDGLLALLLLLLWIPEARRSQRDLTDELIGTTAMPHSLRVAGELTGSLLVGLTLLLLGFGGDLTVAALSGGAGLLLWNLGVLALLTVPPLIAWLTVTRLAATRLSATNGYLLMIILWWVAGSSRPDSWRFSYLPGAHVYAFLRIGQPVSPFPISPGHLLAYLAPLLLLGLLLGLFACVPGQQGEPTDRRGLTAWALVTGAALLLALPGAIILLNA